LCSLARPVVFFSDPARADFFFMAHSPPAGKPTEPPPLQDVEGEARRLSVSPKGPEKNLRQPPSRAHFPPPPDLFLRRPRPSRTVICPTVPPRIFPFSCSFEERFFTNFSLQALNPLYFVFSVFASFVCTAFLPIFVSQRSVLPHCDLNFPSTPLRKLVPGFPEFFFFFWSAVLASRSFFPTDPCLIDGTDLCFCDTCP